MIFISTDYVFDGTQPPYATNAETNPLNFYGKTKRDAEKALWRSLSDAVSISFRKRSFDV